MERKMTKTSKVLEDVFDLEKKFPGIIQKLQSYRTVMTLEMIA